jgi:hypothetical protein
MSDEVEILRDKTGGIVDVSDGTPRARVKGISKAAALDLFFRLTEKGYAVSVKHLGGYYFVEVPVGLVGDPCYGQTAEIQTLAKRAGCQTIQTGNTLRIIG